MKQLISLGLLTLFLLVDSNIYAQRVRVYTRTWTRPAPTVYHYNSGNSNPQKSAGIALFIVGTLLEVGAASYYLHQTSPDYDPCGCNRGGSYHLSSQEVGKRALIVGGSGLAIQITGIALWASSGRGHHRIRKYEEW